MSFLGVVMAALVALVLGVFITNQTRQDLLVAEQRGLRTTVAAIADRLPALDDALTSAEIESVHRLVDEAILGGNHVRVKLWALDGTIRYSDAPELIGRRFPSEVAGLGLLGSGVGYAQVTSLSDPENVTEIGYDKLIEYYIPVSMGAGPPTGVFEIYSQTTEMEAALGRISAATWMAIGLGLGLLTLFLVALIGSTVRRLERDRAIAQESAATSAVLVDAADALASSLDPSEMLERLSDELATDLELDELAVSHARSPAATASSHRLADGTWLVATRHGRPFSERDIRLLRSVASSLDAALANATLFGRVEQAAADRRQLLRRLDAAHEEERRTIVGELHDQLAGDVIRALYGVRGIIGREPAVPDPIAQELRSLEDRIVLAERRLRAFMGRHRPVAADEGGLVLALEQAIGRAREDGDLEVRLRIRGPADTLPPDTRRILLRTAEEALLNVVKHADATRVLVRVRVAETATLSVDDDGCGRAGRAPSRSGRGLGLAYARERVESLGGTLIVGRSRLGGVRLEAHVPTVESTP